MLDSWRMPALGKDGKTKLSLAPRNSVGCGEISLVDDWGGILAPEPIWFPSKDTPPIRQPGATIPGSTLLATLWIVFEGKPEGDPKYSRRVWIKQPVVYPTPQPLSNQPVGRVPPDLGVVLQGSHQTPLQGRRHPSFWVPPFGTPCFWFCGTFPLGLALVVSLP